ncbi:ABC transporter ATP-binding protein [Burkholderiaceae bacterium DAT-1]|nr:ABC transporter ATP-binding protein [Burkholderiaceae bacterium DAT-1]
MARFAPDPFVALNDVSIKMGRGETVGIIGKNGSGKSTLLQLVCGTLMPSAGTVAVHGRIAALLELGAGFNPEFTGIENIYISGMIYGLSRAQIAARIDEIVEFSGIGDFVHQPVKTYSSGMFVRLAFSVIAHIDADVLIVDEALSVGDIYFTQKCMRFLRKFQSHGTVLFVSHDLGAVTNLCDRVIWLDGGRIIAEGDALTVVSAYQKACYDNSPVDDEVPAEAMVQVEVKATDDGDMPDGGHVGTISAALADTFLHEQDHGDPATTASTMFDARLLDDTGEVLSQSTGGEWVSLVLTARANRPISEPLFGFYIKDRLGQMVLGDNSTSVRLQGSVPAGRFFRARFRFRLPYLAAGPYVITAAVGSGNQLEHVIHDWLHEACGFHSISQVLHGLLSVPTACELAVLQDERQV